MTAVWSTRLQKELLSLTGEIEGGKDVKEVPGVLPPFIRFRSHQLDIAEGICKVFFVIDIAEEPNEDIIVVLDASLQRTSEGTIDTTSGTYPFEEPIARLEQGEERFPPGSTIQDGMEIQIDCDWTPSLHLTDAILNVGLKIKESLKQQEPFAPKPIEEKSDFDEILQTARRLGNFLGKSAKSLILEKQKISPRKPKKSSAKASATEINIGDEINFLEAPWVDCHGLYSCKAIRRPAFVEDAMFLAMEAKEEKPEHTSTTSEDDEVPEDFGNFVRMQGHVMSKVRKRENPFACFSIYFNFKFYRLQEQGFPVQEPCSVHSPSPQKVCLKSPFL
jgi:hypothetical protein